MLSPPMPSECLLWSQLATCSGEFRNTDYTYPGSLDVDGFFRGVETAYKEVVSGRMSLAWESVALSLSFPAVASGEPTALLMFPLMHWLVNEPRTRVASLPDLTL